MSDERQAWPFPRSPRQAPTDLRIFDPTKVREIVEAKDAEIAELRAECDRLRTVARDAAAAATTHQAEVLRLRSALAAARRDARDERESAATEASWRERQGDEYGSY